MTYQHALRYLFEISASANQEPSPSLASLRSTVGKSDIPLLCLFFTHDRQGSAAAKYMRAVLHEASISCLHWDTVCEDAREAFTLDGEPLSPLLIAEHAQAVRTAERALLRSAPNAHTPLTSPERCAAVMLRCAISCTCRILLVEGASSLEASTTTAHLLRTLAPEMPLIVIASTADEQHRATLSAISVGARNVISAPCGETGYRRLSDACAKHDCRLGLIALPRLQRTAIMPGSQRLCYRRLSDASLLSGTATAATAAALTAEAVLLLRAEGLAISDDALRRGLSQTALPRCTELWSIVPLIIADELTTQAEATLLMQDLQEIQHALPHPRRALLDTAARELLLPFLGFFDELSDADTFPSSVTDGCTLLIGSRDFIKKWHKASQKK